MVKYLEDKELDSVLESYFNEGIKDIFKKKKVKEEKPKVIDPETINYIHHIYDSFIQWINSPKQIRENSAICMMDIISIYVLFNKPIQDLCNRIKKGKFDKIYKLDKRSYQYDEYYAKLIKDNIRNNSKIIEHNPEDDYVYNPSKNKIFYLGYSHGDIVSDFNGWNLLFVTKMFQSNVELKELKTILEEYDKEKGYNFID